MLRKTQQYLISVVVRTVSGEMCFEHLEEKAPGQTSGIIQVKGKTSLQELSALATPAPIDYGQVELKEQQQTLWCR